MDSGPDEPSPSDVTLENEPPPSVMCERCHVAPWVWKWGDPSMDIEHLCDDCLPTSTEGQ